MKVGQARASARQWVVEEASAMAGFRGAYTAGSTNWLADDQDLPAASDLDVMIVLREPGPEHRRGKFRYREVLLEASYLSVDQLRTAQAVLGDYHLAPSLWTARWLVDPSGELTALWEAVCRDYAKRQWVRQRCVHAREKALANLRSVDAEAPLPDQVLACLFGAGVTTHILLNAGLRNPTVRTRYAAVRELLAEYGRAGFHETLLEGLGVAGMSRARVGRHLAALTEIFDATAKVSGAPFAFASDLTAIARPIAIDGSVELMERGYHREAMFWIAVTHSRCQKMLPVEAPQAFRDQYADLVGDLGMASFSEILRRCKAVERCLPQVWEEAERIMDEATAARDRVRRGGE